MQLNEPNCLCFDKNLHDLYITDTNNHSIKVIRNFK
jgi:hypothetical protein